MATHSSTLAWKIPWTEEPGRLQSMGSRRVGHDFVTSLSLFTYMHWRRKWQSTPVFLPGESQGQGSLVGCRLWDCTELGMTSWEIDRKTVETVSDFIFWGSKIPQDGDCSHEIKRHLLLRRKVMTNLDSIFKSRDITLPTKVHLVKAMIFPVVIYGCESWTVKKAEHRRINAFEMWCWRRLLKVPWTARRSNQSILKEISPGCSLEGLMLKLKLQYFGHLMRRVDSLEKTLMLGGLWGRRRRGPQRMRWLDEMA